MKRNSLKIKLASILLILSFAISLLSSCSLLGAKINGISLKEYTIVYDSDELDYNKRAAEYIQSSIADSLKIKLDVKDDDEGEWEHEIVVGETNRDISKKLDAETKGFEFAILADGGHIALEGDYFIIAAAAYFFIDTYLPSFGKSSEIPEGVNVHEPITKKANNFIIMIGDGMGPEQTRLFDVFDVPTEGDTAYSDGEDIFYGYLFPYLGESRTNSLDGTTDSAAGGTALSTGYKTHNGYVGLDGDGNPIVSLTQLAASLGKATAVMSTETSTGATPASFSAHAADRYDTTAVRSSQAAQAQELGTIIDCGYDYYTQRYMGVIENHVTDTLSKLDADEDGFFLMYEEAYIDKHCDDNDADKAFLALMRFNQVIARFMEYAFYNPDTLVIITADHETGGLTVTEDGYTFSTTEHTSANVPIFAWGESASVFNGATVENTQISKTVAHLMGKADFGASDGFASLIK